MNNSDLNGVNNKALLDKAEITNVPICKINDVEHLRQEGKLKTFEKEIRLYQTLAGEKFSTLQIEDANTFDKMIAKPSVGNPNPSSHYEAISMSIGDDDSHNLFCYTADQYRDRVEKVQMELSERYGVYIDVTFSRYRRLEVNKTILLDNPYGDYSRIIRMISVLYPGTLKLTNANHDISDASACSGDYKEWYRIVDSNYRKSGKKGIEVEIYNKSAQLRNRGLDLDENMLRFEIRTNSTTGIKKRLGTNLVGSLEDDKVNEYFSSFVLKNIQKPFEKNRISRLKTLKRLVTEYYDDKPSTWAERLINCASQHELIHGLPIMLDIEEVFSILDGVLKGRERQYRAYVRKVFIKKATGTIFGNNDLLKYEELINKLS